MRPRKKGTRHRPYQARERDQDHGYHRWRQSSVSVQAASPHESQLVEEALGNSFLGQLPARLIGDKAYDSDPLDHHLRTQDGRPLRRYRRRWTVERLFAWLHNFRRLVTRWEYHVENFFGMVRLGCMKIMLRYF